MSLGDRHFTLAVSRPVLVLEAPHPTPLHPASRCYPKRPTVSQGALTKVALCPLTSVPCYLPASLPPYLGLTVSEHVPIPKGRHRGVTVVRSHHGVLVSIHRAGDWRALGRLQLPCGKPAFIPVLMACDSQGWLQLQGLPWP